MLVLYCYLTRQVLVLIYLRHRLQTGMISTLWFDLIWLTSYCMMNTNTTLEAGILLLSYWSLYLTALRTDKLCADMPMDRQASHRYALRTDKIPCRYAYGTCAGTVLPPIRPAYDHEYCTEPIKKTYTMTMTTVLTVLYCQISRKYHLKRLFWTKIAYFTPKIGAIF